MYGFFLYTRVFVHCCCGFYRVKTPPMTQAGGGLAPSEYPAGHFCFSKNVRLPSLLVVFLQKKKKWNGFYAFN